MEIDLKTILLFKNAFKREGDKQPELKGKARIECPHCKAASEQEVVLWGKVSKGGKSFLSGRIDIPEDNEWTRKKKAEDEIVKQEEAKSVDQKAEDLPF